ncbi:MAG: molybdopterin-dependent oxidoreductase [Pseudomonadota bacterium]|nr:molybdopterin-dependent oxidoreductase [Pseudomonadota bacterium]
MTARQRFRSAHHTGAFGAHVENDRVVAVEPFEEDAAPDPDTIAAWPEAAHAAHRVARPSVRRGWLKRAEKNGRIVPQGVRGEDAYVELPWDEALDLAAGELARVRREHGASSIFGGSYGWSSAGRLHHAQGLTRRFMWALGGATGQVTNYSYGAGMTLLPHILGSNEAVMGMGTDWRQIAEHCDLLVAIGGLNAKNWRVQSGGFGQHSFGRVAALLDSAPVRVVNVSPLRSDTEGVAAEWLPIRPGADAALILALAWVVQDRGAEDAAFLASHVEGYAPFRAYLRGETDGAPKTPAWAAELTGIPAAEIAALADSMIGKRVMLTATWSIQRADHGEQPYWALIALASMLGQVGLPGGGVFFGYGSMGGIGGARYRTPLPGLPVPVREGDFRIPVARVADLLLNPGEVLHYDGVATPYPDIRLVYWAGGNPFHHHQDLNRLRRAFQRPETVIVHEPWWTPTARHADIVFPATIPLERDDIGGTSRDGYILSMERAVPPHGEARDDFAIYSALADRLGAGELFHEGLDAQGWLRRLFDEICSELSWRGVNPPDFDEFRAQGWFRLPEPAERHDLMADFRADPVGKPLRTPSGKIEVFSSTIAGFGYADCPGHPVWIPPHEWAGSAGTYPLHLLSNQPKDKLHSQLDGFGPAQESKRAGRGELLMHPEDAAARGLTDGDVVRVFNDRGACLAGLRASDGILRGVTRLPTGAWFDPDLGDPAAPERHGNPNVLTRDQGTSRLGQGCSAQSCLVEVEAWTAPAPRVAAFDPPEIVAAEG